ncbi:wiskott-Aldrich syndrome protein homolog 1-like [Triticum urartu]|uniref:wiskott-Aldrich syndrome protein homolog 1-like n=1 Tax=Triticum urartu TaxID=4572 RepID=UPI002043A9F8|nr:wiskott-Aldrich syndrome protein homolog 1-like [Triticum urartu]XP_048533480.1 wiskott-Aldrich syndrome protein homolog 1-like [Triticum urartu]XP_048533481.1 wiskott-Aldrich syndrome protein homolog 1-like [Triticum urartu]XP_048533482.1 wiskott-Aldrich syndrome protein homolog 1-like [Triticum urartu]XP_048533483.1 wiskott-Aldrich syndrome protein homolog 1-like [Triticum urartu]
MASAHPSIHLSIPHPSIHLSTAKKKKRKEKEIPPTRSPNPSSDRPLPPSPPSSLVLLHRRRRPLPDLDSSSAAPHYHHPVAHRSRSSEPPNLTGLLRLFQSDPTGTSSCSHERPPRPPLHRRHPFPSLSVDPFEQPPRGRRRHQRDGEGAATSHDGEVEPRLPPRRLLQYPAPSTASRAGSPPTPPLSTASSTTRMTMPRSTRVVGCPTPARPRTSGPARRSSRPPPRVTSKARSPCPTLRCWTRTPPSAPRPWCRPCRICHRFRHLGRAGPHRGVPLLPREIKLRLPLGRSFSYRSHTGTRPNDLWKGERSTLAWY